ncbi:sugar ABC transporter ATP-binding protein [Anaerolentibacter hominis]|uniref:sugar ABC transporter ATP-binding protein n=1 Tax=Anaerolentibacter hominis TaxID=3079009 RepID=UPI0031B82C8E
MAELLEMRNITKRFPGVVALKNLSFDLRRGEVHALVGENGAGKSTLIKTLYGVYQPDEGSILLDGKEVKITGALDAIGHKIGVVFQELNVCPHLDVANNIFLGRIRNKKGIIDDKWTVKEAEKVLRDVIKMDIAPTTLVKNLSIAERQMIEIAKVVSSGCEIIVFDEPTSSLTDNEIEHLFEIIRDLKERGAGIIYISHRLEELKQIADRVTVLRDGGHIKTMDYKDTSNDEIIKLMVGRDMANICPVYSRKIGDVIFEANQVRYKSKLNVEHIELRAGEILGISGLVGAGRSEAMKAIFGAYPVDHKEIFMNGKEVLFRTPAEAIKNGFVYMTEDRKKDGLALGLSVEDNISLASLKELSRYGIMKDRAVRKKAEEFCGKLAVKTPGMKQKVQYLSGGNQQKVILAKWLLRGAKVLVFDEPTRGIDVGAKYEIYKLMNQLSDEGIGIIMISSELPEILGMSDRVLVFRDGRVAAELNKTEISSERIMAYATGSEDMD